MNANFQYIELKDRRQEWMNMSGEDDPKWNCQHLLISNDEDDILLFGQNEVSYGMIDGLYILEKLSIKDEYNMGDGLGISKQGMIQPIIIEIRHSKDRKGVGFHYNKIQRYPNRSREFIKWVSKKM